MSVFKRGEIFHYDFWFQNRRYVGTTRQLVRRDAILCEQDVKRRVRRQSAGLEAPPPWRRRDSRTGPRSTSASAGPR